MDPELRLALGRELRRRRIDRSMSQQALGMPLTRSYVSSVEAGRTVPSLAALHLMVCRLDTSLGEFLGEVEGSLAANRASTVA